MILVDAPRRRCLAVVLAAGEGKRMISGKPKVLHELAGRTMLAHVLAAIAAAGADRIAVVVGVGQEAVAAEAKRAAPEAQIFVQAKPLGTAHAVLAAKAALAEGFDDVLVAFADTPLVRPETFRGLRTALAETGAAVVALGFDAARPEGYGRFILEGDALVAIREHKDLAASELGLNRCNAGLMALAGASALPLLEAIGTANAQKEYYLTDAVGLAHARGLKAAAVTVAGEEVLGVNDREQLATAETVLQTRLRRAAMLAGVTLLDPGSVHFSFDTELAADVTVEPNVFFGPGVRVAGGSTIRAFSHLEGASVGEGCIIGPFARLRPGATLERDVHIGNFVEVKAAMLGAGVKANHLAYIGDATIGARSNIGAGAITCNYNGFAKFKTEVGEAVFIGVNSALVAPVKIGAGAYIGTGSVITENVEANALALARERQVQKPGWASAFRARNRK
ncbi:MAG: bifunctional UDP-N-acetylglucosamine diphosphorylase/glucosamine-1-phosphate N-acetyltransferase GlmU [Beijerinckiaceae bacterium]|nr:MAG: bifunctional UDP-N-acetylglucosamine diphosphorylase/glucosamine-1-phosphate N-acetyltransferase GlmU [Beijerinckiaceae bacterium]